MTNILIAIVVILSIAALVQILRVSELLSEIKNKDVNEVTDEDNNTQGVLFLIVGFGFLIFVIWQIVAWDHLLLPQASSVHGAQIDLLMKTSMGLILVVFFILSPMLFYFVYKYRGKKSNKAYFFSHHNKLEVIWTVVPTIILTGLIIFGLKTWDKAMNIEVSSSTKIIEIYAKQFDWTARYAGQDKKLGKTDFRFVESGSNPLGLVNNKYLKVAIKDKQKKYEELSKNPLEKDDYGRTNQEKMDVLSRHIDQLPGILNEIGTDVLAQSNDDIITREIHLVVNEPVLLKFRSQDVIHSAFLPYFRVQMNCVPGMSTQFGFTPTKTTEEMRKDPKVIKQMKEINRDRLAKGENEVEFDYVLLCNKICGENHYDMQMKFVVETKDQFNDWMEEEQEKSKNMLTQKL